MTLIQWVIVFPWRHPPAPVDFSKFAFLIFSNILVKNLGNNKIVKKLPELITCNPAEETSFFKSFDVYLFTCPIHLSWLENKD